MKKILLTCMLLLGFVGGATSVKAGNVYGHLTATGGFEATWDSGTETMGWNNVGNYYPNFRILLTGLPSGDITEYRKFHATLSNFSENATYVRLRIKSNDGSSDHYADANLVAGENNIDLIALRAAFPDCDFTNVVDITIWSPGSAEEGKTVDADHPASVKIQNVYMQRVKNVASNSLGDEITKLSDITTDRSKFVIANSDGTKIQTYVAGESGASETLLDEVTTEMYYMLQLTAAPDTLDVKQDGTPDGSGYYSIGVYNTAGTAKPSSWWGANYICRIGWGDLWTTNFAVNMDEGKITNDHFGRDNAYSAVWTAEYEEGKGFKFYNPQSNKYMNLKGTQDAVCYLKLYKSVNFDIDSELDKENNEANEAIFDFANATGYDAETSTFTNGGWTFVTPVDISNWDYIVLTTVNNPSAVSCKVSIADNDGKSVTGNQYTGSAAGTGGDMYLDRWNNQNAIRISVDYLRATKGLDVSKIKSLTFANNSGGDIEISIANVYLTDYNNTTINGGYSNGNVKREYSVTGKFGTICLPYKASYAGAEVYSIAGGSASGITLTKENGLLEAGKPYFYMSADENGQNNAGTVRNVVFFRADLDTYDAAEPIENNGLIGTFSSITAPAGSNYYILSGNKLYDTNGCTGGDAVTIGENRAYIDITKVPASVGVKGVTLYFNDNETDGIESVQNVMPMIQDNAIYNLAGQRLNRLQKGINIIGGKKVMVK